MKDGHTRQVQHHAGHVLLSISFSRLSWTVPASGTAGGDDPSCEAHPVTVPYVLNAGPSFEETTVAEYHTAHRYPGARMG